jgi:hypothetical protein
VVAGELPHTEEPVGVHRPALHRRCAGDRIVPAAERGDRHREHVDVRRPPALGDLQIGSQERLDPVPQLVVLEQHRRQAADAVQRRAQGL